MKIKILFPQVFFLAVTLFLFPLPSHSSETTKIASFNIQVFGKSKANKPQVMDILASIISNFDIVAIQEVRDKSGTAIKKLEAVVDSKGNNYAYIC